MPRAVPPSPLPQPAPKTAATWDDKVQSAKIECLCVAGTGSCAGDWPKVVARFFADPWYRRTQGGPSTDLTCTAIDGTRCTAVLDKMPTGWGGRASGIAVLYDNFGFKLPTKQGEWLGASAAPVRPASAPSGHPHAHARSALRQQSVMPWAAFGNTLCTRWTCCRCEWQVPCGCCP